MSLLPPTVLSHFGINVTDMEKMERFYVDVLGFYASDRGVRFTGQKVVFLTKSAADHHQLVLLEGRPAQPGFNPINQISFGLRSLDDLRASFERLTEIGVKDIVPVDHGNAWSLYLKDPEGNPIELFVDSPFHTPQPCRGELDIMRPTAEILARTEALCRSRPEFSTHDDWKKGMRARLARAVIAGDGNA